MNNVKSLPSGFCEEAYCYGHLEAKPDFRKYTSSFIKIWTQDSKANFIFIAQYGASD